jgi:hypothetical protein
MSKIGSTILASVSKEQREEFIKRCTANHDLFESFAAALQRKLDDHQSSAKKPDKYELAGWPYYQADSVGYQRALAEVISILQFKE